jgi:hypothetical protein
MTRVVTKQSSKKEWIYVGIFIVLVCLLFIVLRMAHQTSKTNKTNKPEDTPKTQVIVIDKTSSGNSAMVDRSGIPVYPKDLPRYSNSQAPLDYQQIGILTSNEMDKEPIVLPLFGRKIYGRSDRWQYYTATDKNNMMRIPLHLGSRDCEDTTGCQELYSGDKIPVDIYQGREFTATIYKTDAPRYFASPY